MATEADILAQSARILELAAADRDKATAIAGAFEGYKAQITELTQELKNALDQPEPIDQGDADEAAAAKAEAIQNAYDNLKLAIDQMDATAVAEAALLDTDPEPVPVPAPVTPAPVPPASAVPVISGFSPNNVDSAGGTNIAITGTGFTGVTAVTFGGVAAPSVVPNSDASVDAVAPAGTGTVDLVVTTSAGDSAPVAFSYAEPAPAPVDEPAPQE